MFSSDTAYNPKLAEFAKESTCWCTRCLYVPAVDQLVLRTKNGATLKKHLLDSHTSAEDVGRIAAAAGVKTLVLEPHRSTARRRARRHGRRPDCGRAANFSGKVIVAKDLMELSLPV